MTTKCRRYKKSKGAPPSQVAPPAGKDAGATKKAKERHLPKWPSNAGRDAGAPVLLPALQKSNGAPPSQVAPLAGKDAGATKKQRSATFPGGTACRQGCRRYKKNNGAPPSQVAPLAGKDADATKIAKERHLPKWPSNAGRDAGAPVLMPALQKNKGAPPSQVAPLAGRNAGATGKRAMDHKGWRSRGYLPHFDAPGLIQGITMRLWDALPAGVLQAIAEEKIEESKKRARIEAYLNAGYGACYLRNPPVASIVENALKYFDRERYYLIAWVVMPNHVHILIEILEGFPLDQVVHSWKSYTANEANKLLKRKGRFWFREYFDRYIRDEQHFANAVRYIHENPVKAGLVENAEDWPFSSARFNLSE